VKGDLVFAVPGDLGIPTGGYAYDRRMIAELGTLGWRTQVLDLGDGFPHPSASTRRAAEALLAAVPARRPIVIDGLAFGILPEVAARLHATHPLIALVHHPLALEAGLTADEAAELRASERSALASAHAVVANSATTARTLSADYGVNPDHITVAPPGTDRPAIGTRDKSQNGPVGLLAVGAVVPRKGYDVLIAALAELVDLPWRLTIAGDCGRAPDTVARLQADIARFKLERRVTIEGAVAADRLTSLYGAADLFVLPSRYEGFGMAFAEALVHGLPVIGTTGGAIPDTVPPSAGVLVPPDDRAALVAALRRLIEDPVDRARLAAGARAATDRLPNWRASAELFSAAIERVA
jgi:glycosyltransferase involved in cell wall biosynthesis